MILNCSLMKKEGFPYISFCEQGFDVSPFFDNFPVFQVVLSSLVEAKPCVYGGTYKALFGPHLLCLTALLATPPHNNNYDNGSI